jgi:hypothetical protein
MTNLLFSHSELKLYRIEILHPLGHPVSFSILTPETLIRVYLCFRYLHNDTFNAGNYMVSNVRVVSKQWLEKL